VQNLPYLVGPYIFFSILMPKLTLLNACLVAKPRRSHVSLDRVYRKPFKIPCYFITSRISCLIKKTVVLFKYFTVYSVKWFVPNIPQNLDIKNKKHRKMNRNWNTKTIFTLLVTYNVKNNDKHLFSVLLLLLLLLLLLNSYFVLELWHSPPQ
jgi:hypothetical protein